MTKSGILEAMVSIFVHSALREDERIHRVKWNLAVLRLMINSRVQLLSARVCRLS